IKDRGGFVGGALRSGRRKRDHVACRSIVVLDGDKVPETFIADYSEKPLCCGFLYTTHSHTPQAPRVRMGFPLTRDVSAEEYVVIARYLAKDIGIDYFDECSYMPHQLMYWPTTPANGEYVFRRYGGAWLDPDAILSAHPEWHDLAQLPTSSRESAPRAPGKKVQDPLGKPGLIGAFCRCYSIEEAIEKFLPGVYVPSSYENRYTYAAGESSSGAIVYGDGKFLYSHHATDPAGGQLLNAFDLVRIHLFGDRDDMAGADTSGSKLPSVKAMLDFAASDENVRILLLKERQAATTSEDFDTEEEDESWKGRLTYDRSGRIQNTLLNLELILEKDPALKNIRFNELADNIEVTGPVPWRHPHRFWRDADDAHLTSYIESNYGTFSKRNYDIAVKKVLDDRSYHPILEYLGSLPRWDGECRVDTLLIDYLGAPDTPYTRAVTRKTLCAAVSRVRNPGMKFDTMLVLNGPQGIGKSTLIARLAGEWFSDSLSLGDTRDKTAAEKLQGYWIIEIGELAGLRKAEVETLRSFLSRQNDIYRASFGHHVTPHPRQSVFFGTTNAETGYLRDTTGNRRFWPVKTPGGSNARLRSWDLDQDTINQIWAETLLYVERGEKLYLNADLERLAKLEQLNALETDEREGVIEDFLETLLPAGWNGMSLRDRQDFLHCEDSLIGEKLIGKNRRETVCTLEIWCECLYRDRAGLRRSDSNELTAILERLGWKRRPKKERIPLYGMQYLFERGEAYR
ncbi:MAG: virulence-associated E family protein, partial [Clostridiales bacterium]|nr:virulence-associated E family protein [Clostridiales bacterium]